LVQRLTRFLSKEVAVLLAIDDFCVRSNIKDIRGGRSSAQLEGTQEISAKVNIFHDRSWDGEHIKLMYEPIQDKPSPAFMCKYGDYTEQSIAAKYLGHKAMPAGTQPCMNGGQMNEFHHWLMDSKWIVLLQPVFREINQTEDDRFSDYPDSLSVEVLIECSVLLEKTEVRASASHTFTRSCVYLVKSMVKTNILNK